jgi:hypothetical protein
VSVHAHLLWNWGTKCIPTPVLLSWHQNKWLALQEKQAHTMQNELLSIHVLLYLPWVHYSTLCKEHNFTLHKLSNCIHVCISSER